MKKLIVVVVLAGVVATASTSTAATSGLHGCGDKPGRFAYDIKADFSCKEAKGVVNGWFNHVTHGGSPDASIRGFDCKYRQTGYEIGKIKCKTKHRKVKWITGS